MTLLDSCSTLTGSIPWNISDDKTIICYVDSTAATEKTIMTLADAVCDVTRKRGVTEIRMTDHAMRPKMKARLGHMVSHKISLNIKFPFGS